MAEMEPKKTNCIPLNFHIVNVGGTDTPTNMYAFESAGHDGCVRQSVPFNGSIIALNAQAGAAVGTGSCTFRVFDAGTAASPSISTALTTSATGQSETTLRRGQYAVTAGDALGVSFTSTTLYASASSSFVATIYVQLEQN
jgi:hypothetical protein